MAAISATDAWAVGHGPSTPLIEHWDGSAWSIVPGATGSARLYGITTLSASNIWAVGSTGTRAVTPVIEHFDGTAWHLIAQPVNTYQSFLISVSAASPNGIWAVGGQSGGTPTVLPEHYDGTAWVEVPNPALPAGLAYNGWLRAVTALGPGDVWAVGAAIANSSASQTLALHFDGAGWQVIPSGNPPAAHGLLESVAGTTPTRRRALATNSAARSPSTATPPSPVPGAPWGTSSRGASCRPTSSRPSRSAWPPG